MTRHLTARVGTIALLTTAFVAWAPAHAAQVGKCEGLLRVTLPNTTITAAEGVLSGSFTPDGAPKPVTANLPPVCRVAGVIRPTSDSHIRFEVWLPLEGWNGKFAGVGNGGWAGTISYGALAQQISRGYATASTDTGHQGNGGDAEFAFGHPERLIDFAYRSEHEMTLKAKALVQAYYGRPAERSYWIGCSSGGYQGLMSSQRFPADYDGVVAGAPANNWTRLMAGDLDATLATLKDPDTLLPAAVTTILNQAVVTACDAKDGVTDGVLQDPRACDFDPATIQCVAGNATNCLTPGQVGAARRIYAGLKDPATGAALYPGLARGSEPFWPNRNPANPFPIPVSHYRWLVFADPGWDWRTFEFTDPADYAVHLRAEARLGPIMNATSPDLSAFRARGGKIVQYHGWNDQLIAAGNSIDYYESVLSFFGRAGQDRGELIADVQRFYRLFMIPGFAHCSGGTGVNTFDLQAALEAWVERGVAPDAPIATRQIKGVAERTRPLCPYPAVAAYGGNGNQNDAANFSCRAPAGAK